MKKTVLCIGLAVLDITACPVSEPETWREKQGIDSIRLLAGGDAANQSIHLASLGCHAMLNCCVGDDMNGRSVKDILASRGVDISLIRTKAAIPTGTALLLVNGQGERHIFSVRGAQGTLDKNDLPDDIPEGCLAVSIGSLFGMPAAEKDGLETLLKIAREKNIPVFADLNSGRVTSDLEQTGIARLLPYIDYFLPSCYDLGPMTGKDNLREAVCRLKELGVGEIIVKCGADGAKVFTTNGSFSVPAPHVIPVDTTGAGDCMSAAFISRIIEGDDLATATRYACAAGSLSTLYPGANTVCLSDDQIRTLTVF